MKIENWDLQAQNTTKIYAKQNEVVAITGNYAVANILINDKGVIFIKTEHAEFRIDPELKAIVIGEFNQFAIM